MLEPTKYRRQIVCSAEQFARIRTDPRLHRAITLGRILNALRASIHSINEVLNQNSDISSAKLYNGFLYLAAVLFEALNFSRSLGKYARHLPAFAPGFGSLHSDKEVHELTNRVLGHIRNSSAFHFDNAVAPRTLEYLAFKTYVAATVPSSANRPEYYDLSDVSTLYALMDGTPDAQQFFDNFRSFVRRTIAAAIRYLDAGDSLMLELLEELGFHLRPEPKDDAKWS